MTISEARTQAQQLFGSRATVEIDPAHIQPRKRYVHPSGQWSVFTSGEGRTWEEALNQAEYKESDRLRGRF